MTLSVSDYINPLDVEMLQKQFLSSRPTRYFVIEQFLKESFLEEVVASYPGYEEASQVGKKFAYVNEKRKVQITDPALFPSPVRTLSDVLAHPDFLKEVCEITQIPNLLADDRLSGGGMHLMAPGGHLDVHADFNLLKPEGYHRRLNIIVHLNPRDWRPEWGGAFELWDPQVRFLLHEFPPAWNRCLVFNTTLTSFHGVSAITCPKGRSRNSFAGFYYTKEPPPDWDGHEHPPDFRARPNEYFKGLVKMPVERALRNLQDDYWRTRKKFTSAIKQRLFG
ncbi:MAG: 2OG-Fe(II) oxygenase [Deltaproteobacteria bacterium]|nr:2OG-Fe(II) oxygenase [Deltaproteobacteria bacterium]